MLFSAPPQDQIMPEEVAPETMVVYIMEWTFPKCDVVSACLLIQHIKTYVCIANIDTVYTCTILIIISTATLQKKKQIVRPFFPITTISIRYR